MILQKILAKNEVCHLLADANARSREDEPRKTTWAVRPVFRSLFKGSKGWGITVGTFCVLYLLHWQGFTLSSTSLWWRQNRRKKNLQFHFFWRTTQVRVLGGTITIDKKSVRPSGRIWLWWWMQTSVNVMSYRLPTTSMTPLNPPMRACQWSPVAWLLHLTSLRQTS